MPRRAVCRVLLIGAITCPAVADTPSKDPGSPDSSDPTADISTNDQPFRINFYWENDGSFLKRHNPRDRHYTNGNAMTLAHRPKWANSFKDVATFGETFDQSAAGYILGHMMFTPENNPGHTPDHQRPPLRRLPLRRGVRTTRQPGHFRSGANWT